MGAQQIITAVVQMAGVVDPSLGQAASSVQDSLSKINLKSVATAAAVTAGVVAVGKATLDAGKYLMNLSGEFDAAQDAIRIGTGATGDALEALYDDFDEVYKSVPTTMEDAGQAIADYNTRLGLTGPELQNISKQAIQVSDMLGDDLGGVVEESSQAFQAWNISAEDMGGAMDYVFKASQSTGVGFSQLMQSAQQFAPQLRELGFSFEESVALIGQLDKAGVNTSEVLSAMKKGVASLASQGISASQGLEMYVDKIKNAKDATEATAIASEIFGTKAASTMATAIRNNQLSVSDLTKELQNSSESINTAAEDTYDFSERLQLLKQNAQVALEPIAMKMLDIANGAMPYLQEAFNTLLPVIENFASTIVPIMNQAFSNIAPILAQIPPAIQNVIIMAQPIIAQIIPMMQSVYAIVAPIIQTIISTLGTLGNILITQIIPPIMQIISYVMQVASNIVSVLQPVISSLAGNLTGILGSALTTISSGLGGLLSMLSNIIGFITNTFTGNWSAAWQNVKNIFSSIVSGLSGIFKAPLNTIIKGINSFIGGLNKLKIPDWVPVVGGKGFNISTFPLLGGGGIAETLSIAGEAGQEAVISLSGSNKEEAYKTWVEAGKRLGTISDSISNVKNNYLGNEHSGFVENPTFVGNDSKDVIISFNKNYRENNIKYWEYAGKQLGIYNDNVIESLRYFSQLPKYASGGITSGVSIAGEAGQEAIISFDKKYRNENISYWLQAGSQLGLFDANLDDQNNLNLSLQSEFEEIPDVKNYDSDSKSIVYDFSGMVYAPNITYTNDKITEKDKEEIKEILRKDKEEFYDFILEIIEERELDEY